MRLFHGTNEVFHSFSLDFCVREGMAGNGHLGVWLASADDLAKRFGKYCLDVEAHFGCTYRMPIEELSGMHMAISKQCQNCETEADAQRIEKEFYLGQRARLCADGYDSIALIEANGRIDMYIALDPVRLVILNPPLPAPNKYPEKIDGYDNNAPGDTRPHGRLTGNPQGR